MVDISFKIVDIFFKTVDLSFEMVDIFFKMVDLSFEMVVPKTVKYDLQLRKTHLLIEKNTSFFIFFYPKKYKSLIFNKKRYNTLFYWHFRGLYFL